MQSTGTNGDGSTGPVTNGEAVSTAWSSPRARYERWRRLVEVGFWVLFFTINGIGNSVTVLMDIRRSGGTHAVWEPWTWEMSSHLVGLLLIPLIAWWLRRHPVHVETWRRQLPWHLLGSVVYSVLHVVGMVALRKISYALHGSHYDFGNWPLEFLYEYIKDVRSYAILALMITGYRVWLLRLQGEARLLDAGDDSASQEQPERPERFLVRKLGREFLVAADEIEWLQASGNYVNLHVHGRDYPLRSTIGGVEARLDPVRFLRVHRSYLVNIDQLQAIEPLDTGDARLHLRDGTTLPCSRRYRAVLRERVVGVRELPSTAASAAAGGG
jgi:hypothetical protein